MPLPVMGKGTGWLLLEECVPGAPDADTSYMTCRAQWKTKMQGYLFKNHFKMPTTKPETKDGVLWSVGSCMAVQVAHPGSWPARRTAAGQSTASRKFNRGREGHRGSWQVQHWVCLHTYWILPSVTDVPFQRCPSWLCLVTTLTMHEGFYELKHFYYFEIIWFEKVPKDLKSRHTISRNSNRAMVSERKRTVRFFKYDANIIKFEMASKKCFTLLALLSCVNKVYCSGWLSRIWRDCD